MARINVLSLVNKLKESKKEYLSIIALFEDTSLDPKTKKEVSEIIQETQIHSSIVYDRIELYF